ncbi:MAG: rhodanese-like domain-containing protein [Candidatus Cybelea sp.]
MKSITPGGLAQRLDSGAAPFLLDVREPDEVVDDGCIAGSVNIPMDEVEDRLGEIPTDREIVVYCHLGARSAYITKKLNALGYDRAVNLTGGHGAWRLYSIEAT